MFSPPLEVATFVNRGTAGSPSATIGRLATKFETPGRYEQLLLPALTHSRTDMREKQALFFCGATVIDASSVPTPRNFHCHEIHFAVF